MIRLSLLILAFGLLPLPGRASHVMGGDITWTCQGGSYVFQLVFYRDCNGAPINTAFETIDVWGHPTLTSINLNFVSSEDVSPFCTAVPGSPAPLDCGTGQGGGNGIGAIEKAIYQSNPIVLVGTPPAEGWTFTYQDYSRSGSLTNLVNPTQYGITITAKMFPIPGATSGCIDNSPQFLQEPYFVSCVGDPYAYNMNGIDPDLDSLSIFFGTPLDHFPGSTYAPPGVPAAVPFETGFSVNSPTPGPSFNPGNSAAQIDPSSGNLTFLTNTIGSFAVKVVAQSFRNGVLIAEVMREMQLSVVNCNGINTAPDIAGPFGGLFETTVAAGTLVDFDLIATDIEFLHDGTPQDNILSATGPMFGTNFTSATGCAIAPCATLDATPLITMSQGVSTNFSWQTSCDHLVNPYGFVATSIPYHFVFKVQDNYCDVPKVRYATVTINVENPGIVAAPEIDCIQTSANGDVTLQWSAPADPLGTFNEYQLYSVQSGLLATIGNINTTTYTDPGVSQKNDYFIVTASGCNGNTLRYSDTVSNIFLELNNPANGTALLEWNDPINPPFAGMNDYYHIYREYPAGVWSLYDSVPYGTHHYIDTITICSVFLNYQIVLPNQPCDYTSNIAGDNFEDMMSPDIPVLYSVSIDSSNQEVTIIWNENNQPDTYGYIIYVKDANGNIVEHDVVYGISDTSYTYQTDVTMGPLTYSVAAFDSCLTTGNQPTYQTSAKGEIHTSVFLTSTLDICNESVTLNWTEYFGWNSVSQYTVFGKIAGQNWTTFGTTTGTTFSIDVIQGETYQFVIQATSPSGAVSFSNASAIFIQTPDQPSFNYLQVATVEGETVQLRHYIDASVPIKALSIQKKIDGVFTEIDQISALGNQLSYVDEDVDVAAQSYTYRIQILDSCNHLGQTSNEAQTILLTIENDEVQKLNYLTWTGYSEFNGSINAYNIYRGYDNVFTGAPIATVPPSQFSFTDDVNSVVSKGRICYKVEAIESMNIYNFSERSQSNESCVTLPPLIYIPNAFMPDGINSTFVPVVSDFDMSNYDFTIFDRWGQVVFKSNQPGEGWDGRIALSGKMAETGTYVYMLTLLDGEGIEVVKRGHVSLLK